MAERLITIWFSHYCEKARWALDWVGLPYVEEAHLPLLHWAASYRAGGKRTVPVLVTRDGVLSDSTEILGFADRHAQPGRRLYPEAPNGGPTALEIEERFDAELGPHARRIAFYYALLDKRLLGRVADGHVPSWELSAFRLGRPLAEQLLRRALRIDEAGVARSLAKLDSAFRYADGLLGDGRRYLAGDRPSAADITFAALAAPILFPPGHPAGLPEDGWAPGFVALRDRLRGTAAGAHALRLYAEERRVVTRLT